MSPEEIEDGINKISWGANFASIKNGYGKEQIVILKPPTLKQKAFIDFITKKAYIEATSNGVLTKFELKRYLNERQLWNKDNEDLIDRVRDSIHQIINSQNEINKNSRQYKRNKRIIHSKEEMLISLQRDKREMFNVSAEVYSEELKTLALIFSVSYDENENKLWNTWEGFLKETDDSFIVGIIKQLSKNTSMISIKNIREIARSAQWRFRWNAGKNIGDLFGRSVIHLDNNQQNLVYWSQVYDSVYESYEPPTDDIIEDDDRLDEWFEEQARKRKVKKITEGEGSSKINLSSKMKGHGEIFIMANPDINPNAPTTQEIEELNNFNIRKFKKKEQAHIKNKGLVNEKDLRGRNNKISRKIIGSTDAVLGRTNTGQARGGKAASKILPGGTI